MEARVARELRGDEAAGAQLRDTAGGRFATLTLGLCFGFREALRRVRRARRLEAVLHQLVREERAVQRRAGDIPLRVGECEIAGGDVGVDLGVRLR